MRGVFKAFLVGTTLAAVCACARDEGPLERAGREVDDVVDDATGREESTQEKVGEKIRDLGDRIEDNN